MNERDTGLPASLESLWGLRERPTKGPRPTLSLGRIVDAAVAVAAAEGVAAVSMGRIAKHLGSSPMSLYRYVAAKDELYPLMVESVTPEPPALDAETDWRQGLIHWASRLRDVYRENLWVLRIPVSGPPVTPRQVQWMEQALGAMSATGLDEGEKLSVVTLLAGFVRHETTLIADLTETYRTSGVTAEESLARYGKLLRTVTDPERFPAVSRLLDSRELEGPADPDYDFRFGLNRILDGVEALITQRPRP
ncbi:TetR/AcrR family transcriptional regulator C-terminal domain-containing protein [Streptomyces sp. NPDC004111]|uniref:TetR/AcrR family transcriptional regulator C-terminal domain-containing protein n=1 Tax=Streptomyces sp. NPDC004111 TaxID=3364690 RepID=UPI0036C0C760